MYSINELQRVISPCRGSSLITGTVRSYRTFHDLLMVRIFSTFALVILYLDSMFGRLIGQYICNGTRPFGRGGSKRAELFASLRFSVSISDLLMIKMSR